MPDPADELAAIRALIDAGDDEGAFTRLRGRMRWPVGKQLPDLASWLSVLAELADRRGLGELTQLAREAVRDPDSPDRLYDLGYSLIDAGAPSVAASVLWHCLALVGDSEEVVCELVSALESALCYADAYEILEAHAALRGRSFLCEYLYAFNAAMVGRLDVTRRVVATLEPDSPETDTMLDALRDIVARADRVAGIRPLDGGDLRGWQYVLTGTLVSHLSPYGFPAPMHGRYAWLGDSGARIVSGIERIRPLVSAVGVPCVYAAPGRDHEIFAHMVATMVELPLMPWPTIGVPAPGLVAVYDLGRLPGAVLDRLVERRPDQIVFAHATPWTVDAPVAVDVTTLLYQSLVPPWGTHMLARGDVIEHMPADEREPEVIATELVGRGGLDADETLYDDLGAWEALVKATWPPSPGRRARSWAGGPVPSNRFD